MLWAYTYPDHRILWECTDFNYRTSAYINYRNARFLPVYDSVPKRYPNMSDRLEIVPAIPKDTSRAAKAIFGRSNFYILIGERLQAILEKLDLHFSVDREDVSTLHGIMLALITLFQFVEGLTDVQAIDAVRTRIDWKFALHLSLLPMILHEHELCHFRQKVLDDARNQSEFQKLIDRVCLSIPSRSHSLQNLKSLEAVSFVCLVNCLDQAQQAMNNALAVLAARFPNWLRKVALPHWYGRYNHATPRLEVALLLGQQRFFIEETQTDVYHLLEEIRRSGTPEMRELHEVKVLEKNWSMQLLNRCCFEDADDGVRLRVIHCPSSMPGHAFSVCLKNI